jgi:amino acid adenylation domain-containing protein
VTGGGHVLSRHVVAAAQQRPDHPAIREPGGGEITYRELDRLSDRLRDRLVSLGVGPGERVGLWLPKTIDSVATILGILKSGAAYVPVDPTAPATRNGYILGDCGVKVAVVAEAFAEPLRGVLGPAADSMSFVVLPRTGGGQGLADALDRADRAGGPAPAVANADPGPEDLAYLLYTSGSTGRPKGVMLSQRAASAFVDWCVAEFAPRAEDVFSSHAPFHFDLSILDLYVPQVVGATLVLVSEDRAKEPQGLAQLIAHERISIWYSAPSILTMLAQHGKLEQLDYSALRTVLFAGEVFPVVHLRALAAAWPHPRYFNLYGPTETNVCTHHEVVLPIPETRTQPYPIGRVCSHLSGRVVDGDGRDVAAGGEGELVIAGDNVMSGYWNLPDQTANAFLESDEHRWYRTGDLVVDEGDGVLRYVGRRDRMVKKRGYRVELGEIEACLYRHPEILEAAVLAMPDPESGVRVIGHLATRSGEKLSLIALKKFCSEHLPVYMVPDAFRFHDRLPKTSTDKLDYQRLRES